MNNYIKKMAVICGVTVLTFAGFSMHGAVAASTQLDPISSYLPQNSILLQATPVPDAELAGMRGRFVQGSRITHFGLIMVSQLTKATQTITGKLGLYADLSGTTPKVSLLSDMSTSGTGDSGASGSFITGIDGGGASGRVFHGTFQTVQAAGNSNEGWNVFKVNVVDSSSLHITLPADSHSVPDAVGIRLDLPHGSHVSQSIRAGNGLRQMIRLQGDGMAASNIANLSVGVSRDSGFADTAGVAAAVRSLRNLAP